MELFCSIGVKILLHWSFLEDVWKNKLNIGKEKSPPKWSNESVPSSWKFCACLLIGRSSSAACGFNNHQEEMSWWYCLLVIHLKASIFLNDMLSLLSCKLCGKQPLDALKAAFRKLYLLYFSILLGTEFCKPSRFFSVNMQIHQLNMTLQAFSDWVLYSAKCRCAFMKAGLPLLTHPLNFVLICIYADSDVFAVGNLNVDMAVAKSGMWLVPTDDNGRGFIFKNKAKLQIWNEYKYSSI